MTIFGHVWQASFDPVLVCCFGHSYSTLTPTLIFFSPSEPAAPLVSRLGGGYAPTPAQLAGWSVRRAADRTGMPASTARGADAASAGRRRRRQSPGACAVRGLPKPQCAVVGSRLADTLLGVAGRRQLGAAVRRVTDRPCRARSRRRCPQCRGSPNSSHPHGWLLPASPLLRVLDAECLGLSLTRYCWKCCPAGHSKTACQRSAGPSDCWKSCCSWRPASIGAWCVSCWTCWSDWWTAEVSGPPSRTDRPFSCWSATGSCMRRALPAGRWASAERRSCWPATGSCLRRALPAGRWASAERRSFWTGGWPAQRWRCRVPAAGHWCSGGGRQDGRPGTGKPYALGDVPGTPVSPLPATGSRRDPQLKRAALRPAADEADRLPADRWALGRLPDGRRVRELRRAVRLPSSVLWCAAAAVAADWHQSTGAPDGRQLLVGHGALTDDTTPGHLSLVLTVMFQLFWRRPTWATRPTWS